MQRLREIKMHILTSTSSTGKFLSIFRKKIAEIKQGTWFYQVNWQVRLNNCLQKAQHEDFIQQGQSLFFVSSDGYAYYK